LDGCGGLCGACGFGEECVAGQCEPVCNPQCLNKECGDDGCGSICGNCGTDFTCSTDGICTPSAPPDTNDGLDAPSGTDTIAQPDGGTKAGDGLSISADGQLISGDGSIVGFEPGPEGCPAGTVKTYGKCVPAGAASDEGGDKSGGCNGNAPPFPAALLLFIMLLSGLVAVRRASS